MLGEVLTRLRYLFYLVDPKESSFEKLEEVPNYVNEVIPLFIAFVVLEGFVASIKLKKKAIRINDAFGSLSQGIISELFKLWTHGILVAGYVAIHSNWRLVSLPWDSPVTWFIGLITVDLIYYWLHRASHEVNIFWAAHQVHHSSEDYNLTTALRQSALQGVTNMLFYFPLALIVPPTTFLVHNYLNLLYQFWIHTEVVNKLGPLELILNTPSHHRVHHGRNRYCIDVNYAGVLIIWDRMFGTFQPEEEEVVYGLTHPLGSFDPAKTQLGHYVHIWKTIFSTPGFSDKLSVLFKGPGWQPGKPRLGDPEEIPDIHAPAEKYDPQIPTWMQAYAVFHFFVVLFGHLYLTMTYEKEVYQLRVLYGTAVVLLSLTSIGAILDKRPCGPLLELCRCIFLVPAEYYIDFFKLNLTCLLGFRITFIASAVIWTYFMLSKKCNVSITVKKVE